LFPNHPFFDREIEEGKKNKLLKKKIQSAPSEGICGASFDGFTLDNNAHK